MMSIVGISLGVTAVFLNGIIFVCALLKLPKTRERLVVMTAAIITASLIGFPIIHAVNQMNLN